MTNIDARENYSLRQEAILNPTEIAWPVHIVGLGAVGSYTALLLAKLGAHNLHIYDHDRVAPENVGNQLYGPGDVGQPKAAALSMLVESLAGFRPTSHVDRVRSRRFEGLVILTVDSMSDRRAIFEESLRGHAGVRQVLDVRLGFLSDADRTELGLLLTFRPSDPVQSEDYARSLYDDASTLPLDCRAAGIAYASALAAAYIARRVKQIVCAETFANVERILP